MEIIPTPQFVKDVKRLYKKYPSLSNDLKLLGQELSQNPALGESLGNNLFKIRINIRSKNKGKSGGGRVITWVKYEKNTIWLLTLYDKSALENISNHFLEELIRDL